MEAACSSDVSEASTFLPGFLIGLFFDIWKWRRYVPPKFRRRYLIVVCFFCWVLGSFTLLPWRWKRYVPPKQRTLQELQGVTVEKTSIRTRHFISLVSTWKFKLILTALAWCHLHPRKRKTCL
jgi:hypothetical protein